VAKTLGLARKIAADWANRNIKGSFNNKVTGWAIGVGSNGISKALSGIRDFPQEHLEAITAIPKLLQEAKLEDSHPDRDNKPDIKAIHVFRVPLTICDKDFSAKLTVKETKDGHFFYDHSLTKLGRETAGISKDDASGSASPGQQTGPPSSNLTPLPPDVKTFGIAKGIARASSSH
jgi:hypothetical protein